MDKGECKEIVDRNITRLLISMGINHWDIHIGYNLRESNGSKRAGGRCEATPDYNLALIQIDPDVHDDEKEVIKTLKHELFHVLLSPFDVYSEAVNLATADDPKSYQILERMFTHAKEKAVINLERFWRCSGIEDLAAPVDEAPSGGPEGERSVVP